MVVGAAIPSIKSEAKTGWGSDSTGWYYYNSDSSYYQGQWAEIGGKWYYFADNGYMDYSEYRDGCWLESDGTWNQNYSGGQWKVNSSGWWFEDNNWYPTSQWLWINGECYYFGADGYLEYDCFRDGCWLTGSGAWDSSYSEAGWKADGYGMWFESGGWCPKNEGIWINGDYYWFNESGYYDADVTAEKKASGAAGRKYASGGNGAAGGSTDGGGSAGGNGNGTTDGSGSGTTDGSGNGDGTTDGSGNGDGSSSDVNPVTAYSYEVIPLLEPFADYFYIKTDNPDPNTFRFVDEDTVYASEGSVGNVTPSNTIFADVKYEDESIARVHGGYIATGSYVDGGTLKLEGRVQTGSSPIYNLSTGTTSYSYDYNYQATDVTIEIPKLVSNSDYLIQTYGDSSKSFFDNLSGIQAGFDSICLYSGAYVLGELKRDENSYYGLSTSPHIDQIYYIQDPYYREDSRSMLIGGLYPFRYDSLGFPSMMASIAQKLDSSSTYEWSSSAHYLVEITQGGETHTYGGAGNGGGQGINANQIKYFYSFDGSESDASNDITLESLSNKLCEYGAMEVPDERDQDEMLTWAKVRNVVGTQGAYVRLVAMTSIFGGSSEAYTYLYDDGCKTEGTNGWGAIGHFYNSWFEGRYYSPYEYYYPGVTFEETVDWAKENDDQVPYIQIKDFHMPLPDDGNDYYASVSIPSASGSSWTGGTRKLSKEYGYNPETGNWEGFTEFMYDEETDSWKLYEFISYDNVRVSLGDIKLGYTDKDLESAEYIDAKEITMDEALEMNLDENTNKAPKEYYIYDMSAEPGTYYKSTEN